LLSEANKGKPEIILAQATLTSIMVDHIAQEIPKYLQSRQASDFARFHADKISIVSLQAWFQKYRFMPTRKKYLGMAMPEGVQLTK
jgi:hypothetical protein